MIEEKSSGNLDDITSAENPGSSLKRTFAMAAPVTGAGNDAVDAGVAFNDAAQEPFLTASDKEEFITAFDEADERDEKLKIIAQIFEDKQMGEAVKNGTLTIEQVSRTLASVVAQMQHIKDEQTKKAAQRMSDFLLVAMLDQVNDRIDALEAQLKDRYGEDYIETMAAMYLTNEERAGLSTLDEKKQALFDKYLDENDQIKNEYKDTQVGKDVYKIYGVELGRKLAKGLEADPDNKKLLQESEGFLRGAEAKARNSFDSASQSEQSEKIVAEVRRDNNAEEKSTTSAPNDFSINMG